MTDWQTRITSHVVNSIGESLSGRPFEELPDYATVLRALEDARTEAEDEYIGALVEACAPYGVAAKVDRPVYAPTDDHTFLAFDDNQNGEPGQLQGHGKTRVEAMHALHMAVMERF